MINNKISLTAGLIIWFDLRPNSLDKTVEQSNIKGLSEIINNDYPEFPLVLTIYNTFPKDFNLSLFILNYKPNFVYLIASERSNIQRIINLYLETKEVKFIILYADNKNHKLELMDKYKSNKIHLVGSSFELTLAMQQFVRPELSIIRYGRRNSLSKPAIVNFDIRRKNFEESNVHILSANLYEFSENYSITKRTALDDEGINYNINEEIEHKNIPKDSILMEELFRPLAMEFNPNTNFCKFKKLVINTFNLKNRFDLDKPTKMYYYTKDIEKCNNLKDLCLIIIQKYVFCEEKSLKNNVDFSLKNLINSNQDEITLTAIEDMKYIIISILLGFNKDYYQNIPNKKGVFRTINLMNHTDKFEINNVVFSTQIIEALPKSIFYKRTPRNKQVINEKNWNTEFVIKFKQKNFDRYFLPVIAVENNQFITKGKKTIQALLVCPLTKFYINNMENTSSGVHLIYMNSIKNFCFMHLIFPFSYNLAIEPSIEYSKEKTIKKYVYFQLEYINNYKKYFQLINEKKEYNCVLDFQIAMLTYFLEDFPEALNILLKILVSKTQEKNVFLATLHYYIAKNYSRNEEHKEAFIHSIDAENIFKNNGIIESYDTAMIQQMKGYYSFYVQNDTNEGIKYYQEQVRILNNIYNEDHISVAKAYNHLACAYYQSDMLNEALEYFKKDWEVTCKLLGTDHIETAISYNNLATIYEFNDLNSTSIEFCKTGTEIANKIIFSK